jgi:NAD(P)H dehydrogenase (quinone)
VKALVVIGHPAPGSFCHALAGRIRETWTAAGCEVLVEEGFDPRLTAAEARGQASTDPLVRRHIADLRNSDLLAVVHPNCWGAPPAIVKGWIDRVFAPDAAYGFAKGIDQGDVLIGLLTTKAALIVNTGNTPLEREREAFGDPLERMWRDCILRYCGVRHVMRTLLGVVATSSDQERRRWLTEVSALADEAVSTVMPIAAKRPLC